MNKLSFPQLITGCLFFLILTSTVWLYWQGLPGAFIFDDVSNLKDLNKLEDSEQFIAVWRFIVAK